MTSRMLKCPHCTDTVLQHVELHGQELDTCTTCHGLWFEDRELNHTLRNKHEIQDDYCIRQRFGEPLNQHIYDCHRCNAPMQQYHLLKDYHLEVDTCQHCGGIWVEGDQVATVLAAPKLQKALEQLNRKVSVKSWLFQFFTKMPREYNIKPHRTPYMTWALMLLNTVIFALYGFDYDTSDWVASHLAFNSISILQGEQWWSFISHQFLHGGFLHLVGNMYFLWIIGDNLEDALGPWRFLGYYLLCGVAAAVLELLVSLTFGRDLLMVGASGAIAGLFGMYLLWFRHASLSFMFIIWQKKLSPIWYFIIWAAMNIFGLLSMEMGVAYAAHLGGFGVGLVIGLMLKQQVLERNPLLQLLQRPEANIIR